MTSNTLTKKVIIIIRIVPAIKFLSSALSLQQPRPVSNFCVYIYIYIYYLIIYTTLTQKKQLHKFISKPTDLQLHLPKIWKVDPL